MENEGNGKEIKRCPTGNRRSVHMEKKEMGKRRKGLYLAG